MRIRKNRNNIREIKIKTMKNEEILNEQIGGTLNTKDSDQLIRMDEIENTPFTLVTVKERGSFIAMGRMRLTDSYEREADAVAQINPNNWEFTVAVIFATVDAFAKYNGEPIEQLHEEE